MDSSAIPSRRALLRAGAAWAAAAPVTRLRAADAPIRLVVPYPPGGPLDASARVLAEQAATRLGPIVVENRPGAGGNLGCDLVAKSAPDGRTLVIGAVATHAINPWLYPRMPFDALRDFTPLTRIAVVPNVVVMAASRARELGIATLADLLRVGRAAPGRLNVGSGGNGSAGHLAAEIVKHAAGLHAVHVPYAGAAPAQLALLAGQVDFNIDNLAAATANLRGGRLIALAQTGATRSAALPGIATLAEAAPTVTGFRGVDITTWFGVFGPAGMAPETTRRTAEALIEALQAPATQQRLATLSAEPAPLPPAAFATFVRAEHARWGTVVKRVGATVE